MQKLHNFLRRFLLDIKLSKYVQIYIYLLVQAIIIIWITKNLLTIINSVVILLSQYKVIFINHHLRLYLHHSLNQIAITHLLAHQNQSQFFITVRRILACVFLIIDSIT